MGGVGIDTIRVRTPHSGLRNNPNALWKQGPFGGMPLRLELPGGGTLWDYDGKAYIECSLPKRAMRTNLRALPMEDVRGVLASVFEEAQQYYAIELESLHRAELMRIDIVRDFFDVPDCGLLLEALGQSLRPRSTVTRLLRSGPTWETLEVKVKRAWSAILYDKYTESRGAAPRGQLRFEARLRRARLRQHWTRSIAGPMDTVGHLTAQKIDALGLATFRHVNFHWPVAVGKDLLTAVFDLDLKPQEQATYFFQIYCDLNGRKSRLDPKTVKRYRSLVEGTRSTFETCRLDWDRGYVGDDHYLLQAA